MAKYLLNPLFFFLMLSSLCFARNMDARLKSEFGPDLTKAPFFLRFSFGKEYNKDWKDSSYSQREEFLTKYENDLALENAQEKAEARAETQKEREISQQKREAEREERQKLRDQLAEEKAEQEAYDQQQKSFNSTLKEQQKELQEIQQQATQGSN